MTTAAKIKNYPVAMKICWKSTLKTTTHSEKNKSVLLCVYWYSLNE